MHLRRMIYHRLAGTQANLVTSQFSVCHCLFIQTLSRSLLVVFFIKCLFSLTDCSFISSPPEAACRRERQAVSDAAMLAGAILSGSLERGLSNHKTLSVGSLPDGKVR